MTERETIVALSSTKAEHILHVVTGIKIGGYKDYVTIREKKKL